MPVYTVEDYDIRTVQRALVTSTTLPEVAVGQFLRLLGRHGVNTISVKGVRTAVDLGYGYTHITRDGHALALVVYPDQPSDV